MINKLNLNFKPVVILSEKTIRDITLTLDKFRIDKDSDNKIDIEIRLHDDQTYSTKCIDDIFDIPNLKNNPIRILKISQGSFHGSRIDIKIGGFWFDYHGVELSCKGSPAFTDSVSKEFTRIFQKEGAIYETIISLPIYIISIFFLILIFLIFQIVFDVVKYAKSSNDNLLSTISFFASSTPLIFAILTYFRSTYIGNSVFYWGDGETRYKKRKTIITYCLWIAPITVFLGFITNKIS